MKNEIYETLQPPQHAPDLASKAIARAVDPLIFVVVLFPFETITLSLPWSHSSVSFKMVVLTTMSVTAYGSMLEAGRRSSKYP